MARSSLLKLIFGIGAVLAFFLDGSLFYLFSFWGGSHYALVPCLSLLWLIFSLQFVADHRSLHLEIWAAGIGFGFDLYYTGIWGFFIFVFPLAIYLAGKWSPMFSNRFWGTLLIYIVDLIVVIGLACFANYFVARVIHVASFSALDFVSRNLLPTLFINLILYGILYFPVRFLFSRCQESRNG